MAITKYEANPGFLGGLVKKVLPMVASGGLSELAGAVGLAGAPAAAAGAAGGATGAATGALGAAAPAASGGGILGTLGDIGAAIPAPIGTALDLAGKIGALTRRLSPKKEEKPALFDSDLDTPLAKSPPVFGAMQRRLGGGP